MDNTVDGSEIQGAGCYLWKAYETHGDMITTPLTLIMGGGGRRKL